MFWTPHAGRSARSQQICENLRIVSQEQGTECMGTTVIEALLICEHCDTVYRRRTLTRGEVARCACCQAVLERHHGLSVNALLALVLTAMIVFVQANMWPIVTLGLNGQHSSATLWGTIIAMWQQQAQVVSVLAAATLFFFPLVKMLSLGWLLWFARPGPARAGLRADHGDAALRRAVDDERGVRAWRAGGDRQGTPLFRCSDGPGYLRLRRADRADHHFRQCRPASAVGLTPETPYERTAARCRARSDQLPCLRTGVP
jgi:hypothetical protein